MKIRDLEQARLLSDPLKLQLMQASAEGDKTTKQVATDLGEGDDDEDTVEIGAFVALYPIR